MHACYLRNERPIPGSLANSSGALCNRFLKTYGAANAFFLLTDCTTPMTFAKREHR